MKNLKTFEQFSNEEILDEGLFSKSFKEKYEKLDMNNENDIKKLFTDRFPEYIQYGTVKVKYKNISLDRIKFILKNGYDTDELKSDRLGLDEDGQLIYKPAEKIKLSGKTRLGT